MTGKDGCDHGDLELPILRKCSIVNDTTFCFEENGSMVTNIKSCRKYHAKERSAFMI